MSSFKPKRKSKPTTKSIASDRKYGNGRESLLRFYDESDANKRIINSTLNNILANCDKDSDDRVVLKNTYKPGNKTKKSSDDEKKTIKVIAKRPKIKLDGLYLAFSCCIVCVVIGSGWKKEFYCYQVAVVAYNCEDYRRYTKAHKQQISHLCGNPRCMTRGHLVVESQQLNLHREKIGCCNSTQALSACTHEPKCLLLH